MKLKITTALLLTALSVGCDNGADKRNSESNGRLTAGVPRSPVIPASDPNEFPASALVHFKDVEADRKLLFDWIARGVEVDPRSTCQTLFGLEDNETRGILLQVFFKYLANSDVELASDLLPDLMKPQEQLDWAGTIAKSAIKQGKPELAAQLVNTKFPSVTRSSAALIVMNEFLAGRPEANEAIGFWNLMNEGAAKDAGSIPLAGYLSQIDPTASVKWYESLTGLEEKTNAIESIAGLRTELILEQLRSATDAQLKGRLAFELGGRMKAEGMSELPVGVELNANYSQIELGMISRAQSQEAGAKTDMAFIEQFAKTAKTQEGRDTSALVLANSTFGTSPQKALDMAAQNGIARRNPEAWSALVNRWLWADSIEASKYVLQLSDGELRKRASLEIANYLDREGAKDDAAVWRDHANSGAQEE